MRNLFIISAFICSLIITTVAHAEWTKVVFNGDTVYDRMYVDLRSLKKYNDKIYYWELTDFDEGLHPMDDSGNFFELVRGWYKTAIYSMKRYHEADCGSFRTRILSVIFYEAQMAEGMPSKTFGNNYPQKRPRDWTYPTPKSMDEAVLLAVCNHKP